MKWARALFASTALHLLGGQAAAQEVKHIPDALDCPSCAIELTVATELGDTDGPGLIDWRGGQGFPAIDSRGRIYLRGLFNTEIKVYSPEGEFEEVLGGEGEGPGEFVGIMGMVVGPADSLFVFDVRTMRLSVFDPDHNFVRSGNLDVRPPGLGPEIFSWDRDHFYVSAQVRSPELVGLPIHVLGRDGKRVRSFGGEGAGFSPSQPYSGMRVIADGGDGTIWSGRIAHYWLKKLEPASGLTRIEIRRESEWFPIPSADELDISHGERRPLPIVADMWQDGNRLWVLAWAPDEKWARATTELEDEWRKYDSVVEVIDLDTYSVIARSRFDELYHEFLGGGRLGGTVFRGGLVPVYRVMQMRVVGLPTN